MHLTGFIYNTSWFLRTLLRVHLRLLFPNRDKRNSWLIRIWSDETVLPILIPERVRFYYRLKMWLDVLYSQDRWEREVTEQLKMTTGNLFIDVGANAGFYSNLLSDNFEKIIAFEPDPRIYSILVQHKPRNCTAIRAAISDSKGMTGFYSVESDSNNFGMGSLLPPNETVKWGGIAARKEILVRQECLAEMVPNETIDLVKVDVEGGEWKVLKGSEPIMMNIRGWLIELHDIPRKNELMSYMKAQGYSGKWLDRNHGYFVRATE